MWCKTRQVKLRIFGGLQKPAGVEGNLLSCNFPRCTDSGPLRKTKRAESRCPPKEVAMPGRRKTLLCIDNNQSSLNTCKIILEDSGYTVLTASSSHEGLEVFASNAIDAVILDYQMPEMNGELVAAEMRRTNPRVPILMLSGWASPPKSALQLVDEFISKGDPVEFLLLAVQQLLSRREKRKPVRAVTHSRVAILDGGSLPGSPK